MARYGKPLTVNPAFGRRCRPDDPAPAPVKRRETAVSRFAAGRRRLDDALAERELDARLRESWDE